MRIAPFSFLGQVDMRGSLADLPKVYREAGPRRWRYLALSAAITALMIAPFASEGGRKLPAKPHIIYITTLAPGRSDAEIMRENIANQRRQDAIAARDAARRAVEKQLYKDLGRATGLDVEAMDREGQAQAAADARAAAARQAALYGGHTPRQ